MKPFVENVLLEESFNWLVKRYHCEVPLEEFACPWHYHTEYELVFYLDSDGIFEGKYFAGDAIGTTSHNTLLLYGPGLPHMVAGQSTSHVAKPLDTVIIWFSHQWILDIVSTIPDAQSIVALLEESKYGLLFSPNIVNELSARLIGLEQKPRKYQALDIIHILMCLSDDKAAQRVSYTPYQLKAVNEQGATNKRLQLARAFIESHYSKNIRMDDFCHALHLSESSAYRLFAKHYGCSFSEHLKQYRIGKACEKLTRTDLPIQLIAEQTGFQNLSNFNRHFKALKQMTPKQFRTHFR
ncbi:TPA: AraC family transcriptional regulator [Vibrio vulnificus]